MSNNSCFSWASLNNPCHASRPPISNDIDGFKAIAVFAIILSQTYPQLLPSGFIGIDLLWVLWGYQLTSSVLFELIFERPRIWDVFFRRIYRVYLPLLFFLLTIGLLDWSLLIDEKSLSLDFQFIHFTENTYLLQLNSPFYHLWAIAVFEQFYLIWLPILFIGYFKKWDLKWVCVVAILASFSANLGHIYLRPNDVFYFPQYRAWEPLIGCWVALTKKPSHLSGRSSFQIDSRDSIGLTVLGASLLVFAFIAVQTQKNYPGMLATIPTLGCALLILAGPNLRFHRKFLGCRPLVAVGRISSSWYLWYWPLLIFLRRIKGSQATPFVLLVSALIICAAFVAISHLKAGQHLGANSTPVDR